MALRLESELRQQERRGRVAAQRTLLSAVVLAVMIVGTVGLSFLKR
ncbi:MAG TPA: hypothetical protein VFT74_16325 [Isosphaeraceae bacterium]|nr:hypothetical protein [Isosphaeraceae bacterium]